MQEKGPDLKDFMQDFYANFNQWRTINAFDLNIHNSVLPCRFQGTFAPSWPSDRAALLPPLQHRSGLILGTESHIIPRSLRIPYHPLQMFGAHANQTRLHWASWGRAAPKCSTFWKKRRSCQVDLLSVWGETFHSCQSWHPSPEKISRVLKLWRRPLETQTKVVPQWLFMISYRTPVCADKGKTANRIQI